jgi:hypothetical protein
MWRLMAVFVAFAALVGLTMIHGTVSAQPPGRPAADKQLICHVSDDNSAHIIEVAEPAVPAHLRNHGDCLINSTDRTLIGEPCNPTDANNDDICDVQP